MNLLKRFLTALNNLIAFRVLYATIVSSLPLFVFGLSFSYPSPVRVELVDEKKFLQKNTYPIFCAALFLGAALGPLPAAFLNYALGRKCTLILASVFSFLGWIGVVICEVDFLLVFCRIMLGLSGGIYSTLLPIYICELAHHKSKGFYVGITALIFRSGMLCSNVVGLWLNYRWLALIGAFIIVIYAILMFFQPYSPTWLLSKNLIKQAQTVLQSLRDKNSNVTLEAETIQSILKSSEEDLKNKFKILFKSYHLKAVLIGISLAFGVQLSGINILLTYASSLFEKNTLLSPNLASITLTISILIGSTLSASIVDHVGRKFLLLTASIMTTVFLALFGIFLTLTSTTATASNNDLCTQVQYYTLLESSCLFVILNMIAFFISSGFLSVYWVYMGEIFPMRVKVLAASIVATFMWIFSTVIVVLYPFVYSWIGPNITFYSLSLINGLFSLYIMFFIPETKKMPVDEIERIFQKRTIFCSLKPLKRLLKQITLTTYVYELPNPT